MFDSRFNSQFMSPRIRESVTLIDVEHLFALPTGQAFGKMTEYNLLRVFNVKMALMGTFHILIFNKCLELHGFRARQLVDCLQNICLHLKQLGIGPIWNILYGHR